MSQDFARRKPRKARPNARKKSGPTVPPWLWLATGLGAGLLIGFLYHLASLPREPTEALAPDQAETAEDSAPEDSVEFNFYTLLPQREVMVSEERQPSRAKPRKEPAEREQKAPTATGDYRYYLQAGSFQNRQEAEKRRIQLLLLDLEANIEKVKHQGKSWYRVQAGPYTSTEQLARVRSVLSGESIDTLVMKRKAN